MSTAEFLLRLVAVIIGIAIWDAIKSYFNRRNNS